MKTLFNPLTTDVGNFSNPYLEDLLTSDISIRENVDLENAVKLFLFLNIFDASQGEWLKKGMERFKKRLNNNNDERMIKRDTCITFNAHGSKISQDVELTLVGEDYDTYWVGTVFKSIFEDGNHNNLDMGYCFPNIAASLRTNYNEPAGWLESRTGTFVFTNKQVANSVCGLFPLNTTSI